MTMKCSVSLNIMFKLPRAGGISPSFRKQSICRKSGPTNGERKALVVADDRIEGGGDILDAIIAKGCCIACLTSWTKVLKTEGKRPVRVEGGCPNEVCVLG